MNHMYKMIRRAGAEGAVDLSKRRAWYSTPMISENWATLLEPGLRAIFFQQYTAEVGGPGVMSLYNVAQSTKAKETTLGVGGLGDIPVYAGTLEYDKFDPQYTKEFLHEEYARGIAVEKKLFDDAQYPVINQRTSALGLAFARTRRKHSASVFNAAFSTVKTGDGKALAATDHPTSKQRGGTQSNKGTSALTLDALEATRVAMMGFKDDRGELVEVNPNTIVVPLALQGTAWTIVNSMNKPSTANNDANFQTTIGWNVIVDRHLTDSNNWFVVDSALARMHLWWFDRVYPVDFKIDPTSDFSLVARYRGYMRYSYGADDWRWLYGHEVAS